jgi:serine/threonine protein kinase
MASSPAMVAQALAATNLSAGENSPRFFQPPVAVRSSSRPATPSTMSNQPAIPPAAAGVAAGEPVPLEATRGVSSFMVCGTRFDVDSRYQLIKPIGQGAYGVVCSATDSVGARKVAIKKISKAFEHLTDCKRTLREINILRHFDHENIIAIDDILRPPSYNEFEDVYLVTELMDTDLHQIIGSPQALTDDHCQYFIYQILRGLKYIHSANVLHRDLKPSNILLNGNCDLKICDFGLARVISHGRDDNAFLTEYVATRWYRAPEIMLSWKEYSKAIDMWSVGCIFAEILGRKPLFPGKDYIHQLQLITDIIGTPSEEDIEHIRSVKAKTFMRLLPRKPRVPMGQLLPGANPLAIDLLEQMLQFDPSKRIAVEEALQHPYMAPLHDPTDEPAAPQPYTFVWEDVEPTRDLLKELIFREMLVYHPEAAYDETYRPRLA